MKRNRNTLEDEKIKQMLLEGTPTKIICGELVVSESTVSRRRQELRVLHIQNLNQYNRHQQQLVGIAKNLKECLSFREPAYMDIEDLYQRGRWDIEWELDSSSKPRRIVPKLIEQQEVEFFGNKIKILPCFKAHTIGTSIWADFNKWSKVGGEYIRECHNRLSEIKQDVLHSLHSLPGALRVISTDDKTSGIYNMFYWSIYSYPLRDNWATATYDYKITCEYQTGICQVAVYCSVDKSSPNRIFQAPKTGKDQLIDLHKRLLKRYELVKSLKDKWQETVNPTATLENQLDEYLTQEFVPGTCSLCADWVKRFA